MTDRESDRCPSGMCLDRCWRKHLQPVSHLVHSEIFCHINCGPAFHPVAWPGFLRCFPPYAPVLLLNKKNTLTALAAHF
jgi:hypothetical protein